LRQYLGRTWRTWENMEWIDVLWSWGFGGKWFLVGFWCRGLWFLVDVKVVFLVFLVFLVVWRCKVFGVGILVWLEGFWLMEWVCFWCGEGLYL